MKRGVRKSQSRAWRDENEEEESMYATADEMKKTREIGRYGTWSGVDDCFVHPRVQLRTRSKLLFSLVFQERVIMAGERGIDREWMHRKGS